MKRYNVMYCNNVMCTRDDHREQIDAWCHNLIQSCLKADDVFPRINASKSCRSGWTSEVKPYRDDCIFWYKLWMDAGCPRNGVLYDVMKFTKKQYMYANRRNKRKQDVIRKERMATAIANDNMQDFFKEVNRLEPKAKVPVAIDGIVEGKAIAQHFSEKYDQLLNSVPSDANNMSYIYKYLEECTSSDDADRVVRYSEVAEAIKALKSNKSDGHEGFMSNHLLL